MIPGFSRHNRSFVILPEGVPSLIVVIVFVVVYAGIALSGWPMLRIDRTGVAITLGEHARTGIPLTIVSMALAAAWLILAGR